MKKSSPDAEDGGHRGAAHEHSVKPCIAARSRNFGQLENYSKFYAEFDQPAHWKKHIRPCTRISRPIAFAGFPALSRRVLCAQQGDDWAFTVRAEKEDPSTNIRAGLKSRRNLTPLFQAPFRCEPNP